MKRLGFGAMRITGPGIWGDPPDPSGARRLLQRAVELGIDFIDTADSYGPDVSERLIAEALHPYPKGLVIATKGGIVRPAADQWVRDGRPAHLREACLASLKRLRLERIDLYQFHAIDPTGAARGFARRDRAAEGRGPRTPRRRVQLRRRRARPGAQDRRGRVGAEPIQRVRPLLRSRARRLRARRPCIHTVVTTLAGPARRGCGARAALAAWAVRRGVSFSQAATAWLLARSRAMLPIPGTSSIEHLEDNEAALSLRFAPEELLEIG